MYLTYDEFTQLSNADIYEITFNKLLPKASAVLDGITNHFYQRVDMKDDNPWRVSQFKKALCAQIEYFHEIGATTFESINKTPRSFSAGRTRVEGRNEARPLISVDAFIYLEGTGLLFRGVGVVR